jgi:hypothetical protein
MSPLTVMLDPADPAAAERHRVALATLPARLRIATEPGADAVAVSGRDPDWPASAVAAISSGARGVLVARPSPADVDAVRQLQETASGTGAVVAVEVPSSTRRARRRRERARSRARGVIGGRAARHRSRPRIRARGARDADRISRRSAGRHPRRIRRSHGLVDQRVHRWDPGQSRRRRVSRSGAGDVQRGVRTRAVGGVVRSLRARPPDVRRTLRRARRPASPGALRIR